MNDFNNKKIHTEAKIMRSRMAAINEDPGMNKTSLDNLTMMNLAISSPQLQNS
jgi:hypothetical protein